MLKGRKGNMEWKSGRSKRRRKMEDVRKDPRKEDWGLLEKRGR